MPDPKSDPPGATRTSRRKFLRTAAAFLATGPTLLGAANKSGGKPPIVGEGDYAYECIHDWGELPDKIRWGNTHGVVVDSAENVYVFHTVHETSPTADTLVVFDRDGKFVRSSGSHYRVGAHGLQISKEGNQEFLYLCDVRHNIVIKQTLKGEIVYALGYPSESPAYQPDEKGVLPIYRPTNLAVAPNGDVYVGDGYGSNYVNQYNSKGLFVRTFGGGGTDAPGHLKQPHGMAIDLRGGQPKVLVADRANTRLQYFTLDGKHDSFVQGVNRPCHFDQYKDGVLLIPDLGARVTLMNRKNEVISHLGDDSASDWRATRVKSREHFPPGKFICPHGACFDADGNIFVVEFVEIGRVSKLRKVA